jgi:catechol 2,3-dioxygenase-like lactoylglutathione lyase family enzyme
VEVLFVASVSVITSRPQESRALYADALGLPLRRYEDSDYYFSEEMEGAKHFGVWPLAEAAEACFGTPEWPPDRVVPQLSLEFEVADAAAVDAAAQELQDRGHDLLHHAREEPWGQTVARMMSPEGVILGISYAPWLHTRPTS